MIIIFIIWYFRYFYYFPQRDSAESNDLQNYTFKTDKDTYNPAIGVLLRGNWADEIKLTDMLKLELPVILVSGSGGLADLIIEAIETSGDEKRIQGHVNKIILKLIVN